MKSKTGNVIVLKIGGSTLGQHDTTLADVAEMQKRGQAVVVVHGGGKIVFVASPLIFSNQLLNGVKCAPQHSRVFYIW